MSMAEMKNPQHHVVEILVDLQDHPLMEISESPGHLLLLKLWQREEHLFGGRIARKETRIDTLRNEIYNLCLYFFTFHVFFFTILSTSASETTCRKWWVPMVVNLSTCAVMVFWVHVKLCRYWKVYGQLERERADNRALTRCVQELRMKGVSFDLSKEPGIGNRIKSSSVEIKWRPFTWCFNYLVTVSFVAVMALAVPLCIPSGSGLSQGVVDGGGGGRGVAVAATVESAEAMATTRWGPRCSIRRCGFINLVADLGFCFCFWFIENRGF
ncbi:hypothetical protein L1987_79798 [Smallanthus sonchifolius]|uniref:Uncharacterized protein n=1 Tax=Smallanthus sonchifolius TaxID=185202 RepID=A0ACB8YLY3_9ASTR|nr:hypothetical protein L1987_79798 [Smallanthus sonchifolius]